MSKYSGLPYGYEWGMRASVEEILAQADVREPREVYYEQTVDISADGSGDYRCLRDAFEAVGAGADTSHRNLFRIHEGVYDEINTWIPNFSDVVGVGDRDNIWVKGEMPETVDPDRVLLYQTLWMNDTSMISNLKITARNMRYPLHSDSAASSKRALIEIYNCHIEHYGNEEAFAYQELMRSDKKGWVSTTAGGIGTHSGQRIIIRDSRFVSPTGALGWHNSKDFEEPCVIEAYNSEFICTTKNGGALNSRSLGSGTEDVFILVDCYIDGEIFVGSDIWLSNKTEPPGIRQQIFVYMSGCNAAPVRSQNYSEVLELRSIPGVHSSVKVCGSIASALFGCSPDARMGSTNYAGRIYSRLDISGKLCSSETVKQGVQLCSRLGNCTGENSKTIEINFDGNEVKTIELTEDYSKCSNDEILTILNEKLTDEHRAFYISNPYNQIPPLFDVDRHEVVLNNGFEAVYRGMAVARDKGIIRPICSDDEFSLFVGVAIDDFISGQRGRVQKSGRCYAVNLQLTGTKDFQIGDKICASVNAGVLTKGTGKPLLRIVDFQRSNLAVAEILGQVKL